MNAINLNAAEILEAAAFVIGTGHWCQGQEARNGRGVPVSPYSDEACRWCAEGALTTANKSLRYPSETYEIAIKAMRKIIETHVVAWWNDEPKRAAEEVEQAMLEAAARLRGEV